MRKVDVKIYIKAICDKFVLIFIYIKKKQTLFLIFIENFQLTTIIQLLLKIN